MPATRRAKRARVEEEDEEAPATGKKKAPATGKKKAPAKKKPAAKKTAAKAESTDKKES